MPPFPRGSPGGERLAARPSGYRYQYCGSVSVEQSKGVNGFRDVHFFDSCGAAIGAAGYVGLYGRPRPIP